MIRTSREQHLGPARVGGGRQQHQPERRAGLGQLAQQLDTRSGDRARKFCFGQHDTRLVFADRRAQLRSLAVAADQLNGTASAEQARQRLAHEVLGLGQHDPGAAPALTSLSRPLPAEASRSLDLTWRSGQKVARRACAVHVRLIKLRREPGVTSGVRSAKPIVRAGRAGVIPRRQRDSPTRSAKTTEAVVTSAAHDYSKTGKPFGGVITP